jgi:D-alanine-D-alanine ligase
MWLNEINPMPGSFGHFLWEAAPENPLLFTELLNNMLDEALTLHGRRQLPPDPTPEDARLFKRK